MGKDAIKNFVIGAIVSAVLTALVIGLIIGEKGVPDSVSGNVIGNVVTAIICGGLSGVATTITLYKNSQNRLKRRDCCIRVQTDVRSLFLIHRSGVSHFFRMNFHSQHLHKTFKEKVYGIVVS